ncbi:MAG: cyclase family protein [Clostridiaceae bacterium]|nr:cyclase family protein [Clostridiaceae bacterium]
MRAVDLTQTIHNGMPVYPGTVPPRLDSASSFERDGYRETALSLWSHVGTHMDAPAHLFADGTTLDRIPVSRFCGRAAMLDCRGVGQGGITADMLRTLPLDTLDFVILRTGWESRFYSPAYYDAFPTMTDTAARLLAASGLSGVGVDAISIDPVGGPLPNHRIVLGANMVIVENLRGLAECPDRFIFCAMPLLYENADGAPVRASAWT